MNQVFVLDLEFLFSRSSSGERRNRPRDNQPQADKEQKTGRQTRGQGQKAGEFTGAETRGQSGQYQVSNPGKSAGESGMREKTIWQRVSGVE